MYSAGIYNISYIYKRMLYILYYLKYLDDLSRHTSVLLYATKIQKRTETFVQSETKDILIISSLCSMLSRRKVLRN